MAEEVAVVTDEDGSSNVMELPLNEDGTLSLSTLSHSFHGANGLKYRNPDTGAFRGLKIDDSGMISAPAGGWGTTTFICIFPPKSSENSKRKMVALSEDYGERDGERGAEGLAGGSPGAASCKQKRVDGHTPPAAAAKKCSDLIVLGIPYKTTEEELKTYFEQFGKVLVSQVKRDFKTGKSKGFGFVRFEEYESQQKVLAQRHQVEGRWCDVKVPDSKKEKEQEQTQCRKVFVGRVPESMTADTLRDYFATKGEVTDVFIPKPFRSFAFVTFINGDIAQSLCGEDHIIDGASVYVSQAVPKSEQEKEKAGLPGIGSPTGTKAAQAAAVAAAAAGHPYGRPPPPGPGQMHGHPGYGPPPGHHYAHPHPQQHWSSGAEAGSWASNAAGYGAPQNWNYPPPPPPPNRAPAPPGPVGGPPSSARLGGGYGDPYGGTSSPSMGMGASAALSSALGQQTQYLQQQAAAQQQAQAGPPNGASNAAAATLATQGIGALNLGSMGITPQALQTAISNALAGLVGGQGGGQPSAQPQPNSSADQAALLGILQSAGLSGSNLNSLVSSMAGGGAQGGQAPGARTDQTWSWPATSQGQQGQGNGQEDPAAAAHAAWAKANPAEDPTWGQHGV